MILTVLKQISIYFLGALLSHELTANCTMNGTAQLGLIRSVERIQNDRLGMLVRDSVAYCGTLL